MRRIALILAALVALVASTTAQAANEPVAPESWAASQIAQVVAAGLMAPSVEDFRPDDVLLHGELSQVLTTVGGEEVQLPSPETPVTLRELDARLVKVVGLQPAARAFRAAAAAAGIGVPSRFGSEVVARLLGLRTNHPQQLDPVEILPDAPVTRAETAFSVARVLELDDGDKTSVAELASSFALPELTDWQRLVLQRAFRFVGYPYVWGGSSESAQQPFGVDTPGGFDCSGFVWRVYKLEAFADAPALTETLQGRTTYQMSGEVKPAERVPYAELQPADVIFFGDEGAESKPSQIGHMGINVGNGWFVHSSGRGVTLAPLTGWYEDTFAWARRPLAEAGVAGTPAPAAPAEPTEAAKPAAPPEPAPSPGEPRADKPHSQ